MMEGQQNIDPVEELYPNATPEQRTILAAMFAARKQETDPDDEMGGWSRRNSPVSTIGRVPGSETMSQGLDSHGNPGVFGVTNETRRRTSQVLPQTGERFGHQC